MFHLAAIVLAAVITATPTVMPTVITGTQIDSSISNMEVIENTKGNVIAITIPRCDDIVNKPQVSVMPERPTETPQVSVMPEKPTEVPQVTDLPQWTSPVPTLQPSKVPEEATNAPKPTVIPEVTKVPQKTKVPAASTPQATSVPSNNTAVEQVVNLVNNERAKQGLEPLTLDTKLTKAAQVRANEIEVAFSHTRPNGSSFSTVLKEHGVNFRGAGENIAWGQRSASEVMNAWMNSSGHRANILNSKYKSIGVGYYVNNSGRIYWTQLFTY